MKLCPWNGGYIYSICTVLYNSKSLGAFGQPLETPREIGNPLPKRNTEQSAHLNHFCIIFALYSDISPYTTFLHKDAQHALPILNPDWTDAKRNTIWSCAIYSKILLDLACFFFFCPEWLTVMHANKKIEKSWNLEKPCKIKGFIPADGPSPRRSGGVEPFIEVIFFLKKMAYRWRISRMCAKYFDFGVIQSEANNHYYTYIYIWVNRTVIYDM